MVVTSSLVLINILKLCLNSAGIVLGSGKSPSCGCSTGGGAGFLILSTIGPSLRSTIYGDVSALEGLSSSLGSWGPRMLGAVSDVFVVGSECSYEIVTKIELKVMMTRSSSNRCSLLGWCAIASVRSADGNEHNILRRPTKSSISDGPSAAPKSA